MAENTPTPHPDFSSPVYAVMLQAENTIFTVDASRLLRLSEGLSAILDGYIKSSIPNEGTPACPIVLPDTTALSFANFLHWLYLDPLTTTSLTQSQLIDVLSVSHRWIIPLGVDYAVVKLADMSLSPAFQFHLLRQYDIYKWIPRVTRSLLFTDVHELTRVDVSFLGVEIFHLIQTWREKMIFHRQKLGRRVPYPEDLADAPFCLQHTSCHRDWHEVWISHVQGRVLGPPGGLPLLDCVEYVRCLSHARMTAPCKDYILNWLSMLPMLLKEEEFVSNAVEEIKRLLDVQVL